MLELREAIVRAELALTTRRHAQLGLLASLAFIRFVRLYGKFNPDQPRDDRGRWTGGGGREVDPSQELEPDIPTGSVVTIRKDRTGDPRIDRYSDILEEKMVHSMEVVGEGSGPSYGRRVHEEFAEAVRNAGLSGVSVEQAWRDGEPIVGSLSESVRTDVVLRSETGQVLAVWDLKTGTGDLSPSRLQQLRTQVGIDRTVPIFEMHALRGTIGKLVSIGVTIDE